MLHQTEKEVWGDFLDLIHKKSITDIFDGKSSGIAKSGMTCLFPALACFVPGLQLTSLHRPLLTALHPINHIMKMLSVHIVSFPGGSQCLLQKLTYI